MNKADIRSRSRSITDLTTSDVSDVVLDMYIQDGYDRVINLERRWPFFEVSSTLSTVANDQTYPLSSIGSGNWREVISVLSTDNGQRLDLIGYEDGEELWGNAPTGVPAYYSLWAGELRFWPTPDAVYTYTLRGYRKPDAWYLSDSTEVDADSRLHLPLVYFAVGQMYQLQEDVELSTFYRNTFEQAVAIARADIMRPVSHRPLVLSQGVDHGPKYLRYRTL